MQTFRIVGGHRLTGDICAGTAKNSALPVLAASMLAGGKVSVKLPELSDVGNMLAILERLGCRVESGQGITTIDPRGATRHEMPAELSKRIRSSIFMLGPILSRFGRAEFTYPGGCEIGLRPIDIHLFGLRQLGAQVEESAGRIYCSGTLRGTKLHLDYPSVGATENLMMAGVLAKGQTLIDNAAMEPEIADLARFLTLLGAKIAGAGTSKICIEGVDSLCGTDEPFYPITDRIVAGTLLAACAITGGSVYVRDARACDMLAIISKLRQMGCDVITNGGVWLNAPGRLRAFRTVDTMPYPGFPTDMQAQMLTLLCVANGVGTVRENVFENRFGFAAELGKMGADISVFDRTAIVRGVDHLVGACVNAKDLRGGAALTMAGLAAQGETIVRGVEFVDRGYERLDAMLESLGAHIKRENIEEQM